MPKMHPKKKWYQTQVIKLIKNLTIHNLTLDNKKKINYINFKVHYTFDTCG